MVLLGVESASPQGISKNFSWRRKRPGLQVGFAWLPDMQQNLESLISIPVLELNLQWKLHDELIATYTLLAEGKLYIKPDSTVSQLSL